MLPFIEALPTRRNPKGHFGKEIRGTLIPNGGLPQANEETTEQDVPPPQDLDGSYSSKLKKVRGLALLFLLSSQIATTSISPPAVPSRSISASRLI